MPWTNEDGLTIKFGIEEVEKARVTEVSTAGGMERIVEIVVTSDELPTVAENSVVIDDSYVIPAGAVFTGVRMAKSVTFVGSGATLNIGITDAFDGGSTLTDVDALVVEATIAELNAGGKDVAGWIGTKVTDAAPLTEAVRLTWEVNTAAITDGKATFYVHYQVPKDPDTDSLVWTKP
jgi:hypothetical protein